MELIGVYPEVSYEVYYGVERSEIREKDLSKILEIVRNQKDKTLSRVRAHQQYKDPINGFVHVREQNMSISDLEDIATGKLSHYQLYFSSNGVASPVKQENVVSYS